MRTGKRERLVAAAGHLFYEQGVERTTLAEIAAAAEVPLGNVYYYFKTKDDLIAGVVDAHVAGVEGTIAALEQLRSPARRLKGFIGALADEAERVAEHGCPRGTLCGELGKRSDVKPPERALLLRSSIEWVELQFQQIGRTDAGDLAVQLIGAYQGATVLAHAHGQSRLLTSEVERLQHWIDAVANGAGNPACPRSEASQCE